MHPASVPGALLTGATGFLGAYLLKELLARSSMPVFCLCRASGTSSAQERLMENLHFLFGADQVAAWPLDRVKVINGDLDQPHFGLAATQYAALTERTTAVFHVAALLWHFGKVEQFRRVNVQAVANLLAFCQTGAAKTLNHVSTLAVSGRRCDNPDNRFTEADFHENLNSPNVYVETKYEAERQLRPALLAARPVRIFRPGFLMGDSITGRFKKHISADAQYLHLQGHIFMRTAPPLYDDDYMDVTPVDYAAAAIAHIALLPDTAPGVYHICNPSPILKAKIWDMIRDYGFPARIVPPDRYLEEVLDQDDELFLRGLQTVLVYLDDYQKSPAIFDASRALRRLQGSGISCPPPDRMLLSRYLDYCVEIGFLPHPDSLTALEHP